MKQQRKEELRRIQKKRNSDVFRSMAVELHILVCRWVSPLVIENWNRQAQLGSCNHHSYMKPGRVLGHWWVGWGCTGQMLSLGVEQGRRAVLDKGKLLKPEAQKQAWSQSSFLLG